MSEDEEVLTRADVVVEFLEVAFHTILYVRNLYPKTIFKLQKKYDVAVHVSVNPKVNEYITECLKTARGLLQRNNVEKISLLVSTESGAPVERYVFEIASGDETALDDRYFVKTEEVFREYLLKLSVMDSRLGNLPEQSLFSIQLTTTEQSSVRLNESAQQFHFPWVESAGGTVHCGSSEVGARIVPLRTMDTTALRMKMFVEDFKPI